MGKNGFESFIKRNKNDKPVNPIALFLAFIVGAVMAFAAAWHIRSSRDKNDIGASDNESAQNNRELKKLIRELRSENEQRRRADCEERTEGVKRDSGEISQKQPASVQTQQIRPYRPRRRVSVKKIFGRTIAPPLPSASYPSYIEEMRMRSGWSVPLFPAADRAETAPCGPHHG